jgi:hypothetical protein
LKSAHDLLLAFRHRLYGFFVSPVRTLEAQPEEDVGVLFASALLVAALVEAVARVDGEFGENDGLIAAWLEARVSGMADPVLISGSPLTAAAVFEQRFRHGLAHQGYIASRGRVSREIGCACQIDDDVVTIDPFLLLHDVVEGIEDWVSSLMAGSRNISAFQHRVVGLFQVEVKSARQEAAGGQE